MHHGLKKSAKVIFLLVFMGVFIAGSNNIVSTRSQLLRSYTRKYEFDFVEWTSNSLIAKIIDASLHLPDYFPQESKAKITSDYVAYSNKINELKNEIQQQYGNPANNESDKTNLTLNSELEKIENKFILIKPSVERILSEQIQEVLAQDNISKLRFTLPPLMFDISELPENLIISPRDKIEQEYSISLVSGLKIDEIDDLETIIDSKLDVSSLVVPIGGLGTYPTMIEASSSLPWVINTIIHEWTHNWLVFRPLGWNYGKSNELRTMNETTASIIGNEIEVMVLKDYYPIYYDTLVNSSNKTSPTSDQNNSMNVFDYHTEMRITRVEVDSLLAMGKIDEAEAYMNYRRNIFWQNGYQIRKLNQAFFAFYGAYADIPVGAAGDDPVGPAVRKLREQSGSISEFLFSISRMSSFSDLLQSLK